MPERSIVNGPKVSSMPQEASAQPLTQVLSQLPSTDRLVSSPVGQALVQQHGATLVTQQARELLTATRQHLLGGGQHNVELSLEQQLAQGVAAKVAPRLKPMLNLTGTVIHTNMGRAVLPQVAIDYVHTMMQHPLNLEYDLRTGQRGDRDSIVEGLICEITGAQAATVVNNNAAAVLLTIAALARGREVIVSRGELVEIGGAFRMPDVMASAGASMVEVGTTNRTHLADYQNAITPETALLMKVHTSNYVVQGFTAEVTEAALAPLAAAKGIPLATDLGSGSLMDMSRYGLPKEPTPQEMIAAGCDVVTFSGDKLLGGPQAGLIVGSQDAINKIKKFPMKRALRLSKLPLAALEATLRLYLQPELLRTHLPTLRWLTRSQSDILNTAQTVCPAVQQALGPRFEVRVQNMMSQIGSGSLPIDTLPSAGLSIAPKLAGKKGLGTALDLLEVALRALPTPVIGRIDNDHILWDCRCLDHAQDLTKSLQFLKL